MEQPTKYSNQRPAGREHIPLYPRGFVIVRILQLIFAIICLGLSGFGIVFLVFAGDALTLFTVSNFPYPILHLQRRRRSVCAEHPLPLLVDRDLDLLHILPRCALRPAQGVQLLGHLGSGHLPPSLLAHLLRRAGRAGRPQACLL